MHITRRGKVLSAATLFACFFLIVSCSTTPSRYRGSLSDAMDKAKDDHEGDRSVPDDRLKPDYPRRDAPDRRDPVGPADSAPLPLYTEGPSDFWLGFRGGNGLGPDRDIEPLSDGDIFAGGEASPNFEFDLYAGFKAAQAVDGSSLDERIKDPLLFLKAGVEGRYSPFPDWLFMSPYVSAGMGGFYMGWNFRNALTAGSETITSDSVTGLLLNVGAGIYPLRLERFRLGIGIVPEVCLFGPVTGEGFDNDYFDAFSSVKVIAEIAVKF